MGKSFQDPVVEEVRKRGQKYTERFQNDIKRICEDLKKAEKKHSDKIVSEIVVIPKKSGK